MDSLLKQIVDNPNYTWETKVNHTAKELHIKKYDAWILLDTYRFTTNQIEYLKDCVRILLPEPQKAARVAKYFNISSEQGKSLILPYSMKMYENQEQYKVDSNGDLVKVPLEDYDLHI